MKYLFSAFFSLFLCVCAFSNTFGLTSFTYASSYACFLGPFSADEPCALYLPTDYLLMFTTDKSSYVPGESGSFTLSIQGNDSSPGVFAKTTGPLGTRETNSSLAFQATVPYDYELQGQQPIQYFNQSLFGKSLTPDNLPFSYFGPGGANTEIAVVGATLPHCSNGVNDDSDGLVDALDPQCHSDCNASNSNSYVPSHTSESTQAGTCSAPTLNLSGRSAAIFKSIVTLFTTSVFAEGK